MQNMLPASLTCKFVFFSITELASKELVDSYIQQLNIKNGRINFDSFTQFIGMLDHVLVDNEGNLVDFDNLSNAIDLSNLEDEDDEDDE